MNEIKQLEVKKIVRSLSKSSLGKTAYDLPTNIVDLIVELRKDYDVTLERRSLEGVPLSDILTPKTLNWANEKKNSAFNNPIKAKKKTRAYTKPTNVLEPSEFEPFTRWKNTKDINSWTAFDFLGYYFSKYKDYYGYEDASFVGSKWTKSGKTKGRLNNFMLVSKVIESFISFMTEMKYGNEKTKEYIDYVFDNWLKNNQWYKADITPYKFFSVEKNFLWGQYYKEILNKKAVNKKYNPVG